MLIEKVVRGESKNNWSCTGPVYQWPQNVVVQFPNGDKYDRSGGRNNDGWSIATNENSIVVGGSPCHRAMEKAGITLEEV